MLRAAAALGLSALFVAVAASPALAVTEVTTIAPTAAGCQVKGLGLLPAPKAALSPGLAANVYRYTVTAVTATGEVAPACAPITTQTAGALAGQDSVVLQWANTPGALAYTIYREAFNGSGFDAPVAMAVAPGPPPVTTIPATAICPPGGVGTGARCAFQDNDVATTAKTPPASAAALTQAGSHPDLAITTRIDYGGASSATGTDDPIPDGSATSASLKSLVLHFPEGVIANPVAASATCPLTGAGSLLGDVAVFGRDDPSEDTCPRASEVGSVSTLTRIPTGAAPPTLTIPTVGTIYQGTPKAGEPGRLYVVLRPGCSAGSPADRSTPTCQTLTGGGGGTRELEKQFLAGVATTALRADGSFGIDVNTVNAETDGPLSKTLTVLVPGGGGALIRGGAIPIQVQSLTQHLFGYAGQDTASTADDTPFVTLPTAPGAKTFSADTTTYADATVQSGSNSSLIITGEGNLPFAPQVNGVLSGDQQAGGHPKLVVTVSQAAGEAATKSSELVFPASLSANATALAQSCTETQLASGVANCPAGTVVGSASATSAALPGTLSGPVVLMENPTGFPKLAVLLNGVINLRLTATVAINAEGRLVNQFPAIPDVPLNSFAITLDGGAAGLLSNVKSLCTGAGNITGSFTGHNGATSPVDTTLAVDNAQACPPTQAGAPKVSGTLSGIRKGQARLAVAARRIGALGADRIKKIAITLPSGLTIVKHHSKRITAAKGPGVVKRSSLALTAHGMTVSGIGNPSTSVRATLRPGSLEVSRALRRKGTAQRVVVKVAVTDATGLIYRTTLRLKPAS